MENQVIETPKLIAEKLPEWYELNKRREALVVGQETYIELKYSVNKLPVKVKVVKVLKREIVVERDLQNNGVQEKRFNIEYGTQIKEKYGDDKLIPYTEAEFNLLEKRENARKYEQDLNNQISNFHDFKYMNTEEKQAILNIIESYKTRKVQERIESDARYEAEEKTRKERFGF